MKDHDAFWLGSALSVLHSVQVGGTYFVKSIHFHKVMSLIVG